MNSSHSSSKTVSSEFCSHGYLWLSNIIPSAANSITPRRSHLLAPRSPSYKPLETLLTSSAKRLKNKVAASKETNVHA